MAKGSYSKHVKIKDTPEGYLDRLEVRIWKSIRDGEYPLAGMGIDQWIGYNAENSIYPNRKNPFADLGQVAEKKLTALRESEESGT